MTPIESLILDQLEFYTDRIVHFRKVDVNPELEQFFRDQADSLLNMEQSDELMSGTYHRHLSESFGIEFETAHGDPELMFGGV